MTQTCQTRRTLLWRFIPLWDYLDGDLNVEKMKNEKKARRADER